jgi:hypothetical protein
MTNQSQQYWGIHKQQCINLLTVRIGRRGYHMCQCARQRIWQEQNLHSNSHSGHHVHCQGGTIKVSAGNRSGLKTMCRQDCQGAIEVAPYIPHLPAPEDHVSSIQHNSHVMNLFLVNINPANVGESVASIVWESHSTGHEQSSVQSSRPRHGISTPKETKSSQNTRDTNTAAKGVFNAEMVGSQHGHICAIITTGFVETT